MLIISPLISVTGCAGEQTKRVAKEEDGCYRGIISNGLVACCQAQWGLISKIYEKWFPWKFWLVWRVKCFRTSLSSCYVPLNPLLLEIFINWMLLLIFSYIRTVFCINQNKSIAEETNNLISHLHYNIYRYKNSLLVLSISYSCNNFI